MPKLAVLIHGVIDSKMHKGRGDILHLSVICMRVLDLLDLAYMPAEAKLGTGVLHGSPPQQTPLPPSGPWPTALPGIWSAQQSVLLSVFIRTIAQKCRVLQNSLSRETPGVCWLWWCCIYLHTKHRESVPRCPGRAKHKQCPWLKLQTSPISTPTPTSPHQVCCLSLQHLRLKCWTFGSL